MHKIHDLVNLEETVLDIHKYLRENLDQYEHALQEEKRLSSKIKKIEKEIADEANKKERELTGDLRKEMHDHFKFSEEYKRRMSIHSQLKRNMEKSPFKPGQTLRLRSCNSTRCGCSFYPNMDILLTGVRYHECGYTINFELVGIIKKITDASDKFELFGTVNIMPCSVDNITIL